MLLYRGSTLEAEWVLLQRGDGSVLRVPCEWTDLRACDPYQDLSPGQNLFRLPELVALVSLLKSHDP